MQFRSDINGLRAIAVIAVMLFHFNASWMPGGFAGVDVFFVISGFLMTGIIFRGIAQENFSILKFYVARANRIIPALAVLCFALLVFGWFYLTPVDYRELGKHIASSMGFVSNMLYWTEAGYFDTSSHEKWLLHTWSLSVEWQFYIIYPLLLVVMYKFMSIGTMKLTLLIATVVAFIFSVFVTMKLPDAAYYLLPTRAWEMMLGGVAYLYPLAVKESSKKFYEWLGLGLIVASYLFISQENLWPGYLAIFPVMGAFLLIQAQRNDSLITGNFIFQKLGKWSYSIYLWHWPLVVAIYYFSLDSRYIYAGIALSILLGFLSYHYIESFRFRSSFSGLLEYLKCKPIYMMAIIGVLGSAIFVLNGAKERFGADVVSVVDYSDNLEKALNPEEKMLKKACDLRNWDGRYCNRLEVGHYDAILLGDSYAGAYSTGVNASLLRHKSDARIVNAGASGCLPVLGMHHRDADRESCKDYNEKNYQLIADNYKDTPIIVTVRLNLYPFGFVENGEKDKPYMYFDHNKLDQKYMARFKDNFIKNMCTLAENNPVYLVKPIPEYKEEVPKIMAKQKILGQDVHIEMTQQAFSQRNSYIDSVLKSIPADCNVEVIDVTSVFMTKEGNYSPISKNGMPLYSDENHLNVAGASLVSPFFDHIWK